MPRCVWCPHPAHAAPCEALVDDGELCRCDGAEALRLRAQGVAPLVPEE